MFRLTAAEDALRDEVRRFFATDYPQHVIAKLARGQRLDKADHIAAQTALAARGWLGVGWPQEFGGPGWTPRQRYLFDEQLELAGAAAIIPMGVIYIGPIICAFGSAMQQQEWLPAILQSRTFWAQGYSEPEAGSDLASLRFAARREGDHYVLNGTKIWTSGAQWADWIFCLARTSEEARKHEGLSLICSPLDAPGVTVHPIRLLDGSHELNRVEFVDVRVPVANRIGDEGRAWHYANVLLRTERLSYAHIGSKRRDLARLRSRAVEVPTRGGATMAEDAGFLARAAALNARIAVIEAALISALDSEVSAATAGLLKIACTECAQAITELGLELAGRERSPMLDRMPDDWAAAAPAVPSFGPTAVQKYLFERAQTIYGGSTEVQKLIVWRELARGGAAAIAGPLGDTEGQAIASSIRAALHGSDSAAEWRLLVRELGLLAEPFSGELGAAVMEQAGRAGLAEPLSNTWAILALLEALDGDADALRAALSDGQVRVALAWAEPGLRYDFTDIMLATSRSDGGWQLDGTKSIVIGGPDADVLLVAARTGHAAHNLGLFAVPRDAIGVAIHPYRTVDGRTAADMVFTAVTAAAPLGDAAGALPLLEQARDTAIALQCAEAVGVLDALLDATLVHTATRRQFGHPLADFQVLQHRMVDMAMHCALARAAARLATDALSHPSVARGRAVSQAMVEVSRACRFVHQQAIQLHGGTGMTDEIFLSRLIRRAVAIEAEWGDRNWHLERIARSAPTESDAAFESTES